MDRQERLQNELKRTEIAMKKTIKEQGDARRKMKTFEQFPNFTKETLAAEYHRGRLHGAIKQFKDLSKQYIRIKSDLENLK